MELFRADISLFFNLDKDLSWNDVFSGYMSTYTFVVFLLAKSFNLVTNVFDLRVVSVLFKLLYVYACIFIYEKINERKVVAFDFLLLGPTVFLFICSSSNIGYFSSLYQEQLVLIALPFVVACLSVRENTMFSSFLIVFCSFLIGGWKN